tara:strand:- start:5954 stop:6184 length:231 start_codon:yes stop_codon:yes gene_type:complete
MSQTTPIILMNEDVLTHVLTTNNLHPYNISIVSKLWSGSTVDYLVQKKDDADKLYVAFWMLRSYARSFWDMDFMPY